MAHGTVLTGERPLPREQVLVCLVNCRWNTAVLGTFWGRRLVSWFDCIQQFSMSQGHWQCLDTSVVATAGTGGRDGATVIWQEEARNEAECPVVLYRTHQMPAGPRRRNSDLIELFTCKQLKILLKKIMQVICESMSFVGKKKSKSLEVCEVNFIFYSPNSPSSVVTISDKSFAVYPNRLLSLCLWL